MSFEEMEHTADFLFRCRGKTMEELFSETASAMFSIMFESKTKENSLNRKEKSIISKKNDEITKAAVKNEFDLTSDSYENLLVDFLSELLFLSEINGLVFSDVRVFINDFSLHAEVFGEEFDRKIHLGGAEIKGISRSGVKIINKSGNYQVDVIFDV
ncbi:archease [Methanomicrobium antiquum]|uniref:Archease n=1 Tax=Methanomicrobium antiquum TaxID=487686 RepID=A0AAF0JN05_9EURY|nr:archease [Methanomicrobium antiquum]MDD3978004.1 archease [Methanomicrobium sp.]WFN37647.1 archease [Methanomicrobium antiquum]